MIAVQDEKKVYRSHLDQLEKDREGSVRLQCLREDALSRLEELVFPSGRDEDWKFTSLASLAKVPFKPARRPAPGEVSLAQLEQAALPLGNAQRLVFLNGSYLPELSRVD